MTDASAQRRTTRAAAFWQAAVARWPVTLALIGAGLIALAGTYVGRDHARRAPEALAVRDAALRATLAPPPARTLAAMRQPPPFVKGIYVSAAAAGTRNMFAGLVDLVDRTELNAMVIDIKESSGELAFVPRDESLKAHAARRPDLGNLSEFTKPLRDKGIWLIARLFVFQDPAFVKMRPEVAVHSAATGGVWHDRKGMTWVDAAHQDAWDYTVKVAREAYAGGFDEVQFDYIRFPTDGKLDDMRFPAYDPAKTTKADNMGKFFAYLDDHLAGTGVKLSVDLFGLTMWQHDYDLNIGQRLDTAAPHFDYISPMVYPSHYPPGFEGFKNPADHPYEVVHDNMAKAKPLMERLRAASPDARIATFRPWIQDFDLGAKYTPDMVRAQMRASVDGGATGWLLWNARNRYTEAALLPEARPTAAAPDAKTP